MTEKLKVSREVADAIERIKVKFDFEEIMAAYIRAKDMDNEWAGGYKSLNTLEIEELATVLINGYEVEMTPHEEIAVIYKHHYPKSRDGSGSTQKYFSKGYVKGIKFTLEKLGITIKGVNDK